MFTEAYFNHLLAINDEEVEAEIVRITHNLRRAFAHELGKVPVFGTEINCAIVEKAEAIVEERRKYKPPSTPDKRHIDEANRMMMDYHHDNPLF